MREDGEGKWGGGEGEGGLMHSTSRKGELYMRRELCTLSTYCSTVSP